MVESSDPAARTRGDVVLRDVRSWSSRVQGYPPTSKTEVTPLHK